MMQHDLTHAIIIWRFEDAPEAYRILSRHGGVEDWLAFVPAPRDGDWIGWLELNGFGCAGTTKHPVDGGTVYIGANT